MGCTLMDYGQKGSRRGSVEGVQRKRLTKISLPHHNSEHTWNIYALGLNGTHMEHLHVGTKQLGYWCESLEGVQTERLTSQWTSLPHH